MLPTRKLKLGMLVLPDSSIVILDAGSSSSCLGVLNFILFLYSFHKFIITIISKDGIGCEQVIITDKDCYGRFDARYALHGRTEELESRTHTILARQCKRPQ